MQIDASGWTEEGAFTATLIGALETIEAVSHIRVEDAPASRTDAGYAFISNEVFVRFRTHAVRRTVRAWGLTWPRTIRVDVMTIEGLGEALGSIDGVGPPDYADAGLLQYLRTERIVPPYQTRGIKVVEMVRVYLAGSPVPDPKS
ncbi:MAG: hypothetical protein WCP29_14400 [Acidobacteriota bacterium]